MPLAKINAAKPPQVTLLMYHHLLHRDQVLIHHVLVRHVVCQLTLQHAYTETVCISGRDFLVHHSHREKVWYRICICCGL